MSKLNVEFLEYVYVRGLEGMLSDKFLEKIVAHEWTNTEAADNAYENHMEAKQMATQLFFRLKGWAL